MTPYIRKTLQPGQVADLYRQALESAEVAELNAWLNLVLNPDNPVNRAAYELAAARYAELAADGERVRTP